MLICGDSLLELKSLKDNSIDACVTDPPYGLSFMGSGSTGVAAKNLGFDFIGIELSHEYFEIAKRRIGHKAERQLDLGTM